MIKSLFMPLLGFKWQNQWLHSSKTGQPTCNWCIDFEMITKNMYLGVTNLLLRMDGGVFRRTDREQLTRFVRRARDIYAFAADDTDWLSSALSAAVCTAECFCMHVRCTVILDGYNSLHQFVMYEYWCIQHGMYCIAHGTRHWFVIRFGRRVHNNI